MKLDEIVMVGEAIADAVKAWDSEKVDPIRAAAKSLADSIKALQERLDSLPVPVNGKDGKDGIDGKDGRDGINGKDGAPGKDGMYGDPGPKGDPGKDGENGIDGKDGAPGSQGEPGPKGDKGEKGDPGEKGQDGRDGRNGIDGRDGKDGPPGMAGKDALEIEPLAGMDESASYQRGTWLTHRGGLFRAFRTTDPVQNGDYAAAGWQLVVCGMADVRAELAPDQRTFVLSIETSDGKTISKSFKTAAQIYRGVYREGIHYEKGDTVTHGGSTWHANEGTSGRPGEASSWQLMTKRGRDGKDAGEK